MKKQLFAISLCLLVSGCARPSVRPAVSHFNILTGMKADQLRKIHKHYDLIVINADHLHKKDISRLHDHAKKVYAYLDIAAIAPSSKSYAAFRQDITAPTVSKKKYYINTADKKWQQHVIAQAQSLKKKGADGYLLDHTDICDYKKSHKITRGLKKIIRGIEKEKKPILLKNAMTFTDQAPSITKNIQGVVQEDVFTYWNHKHNDRENTPKDQSNDLKIYLNQIKDMKKAVYVVDFTKKSDWQAVINAEGKKYGWRILLPQNTSYSIE